MIINGIEFDFSTLNANDVERMLAAKDKQQERAKTEGSRYTPESDYPAWLRFQCRIFMDYLDEVLGEGASAKLGLDGSNFNDCLKVSKAFADAMAAEKAAVNSMLHPADTQKQAAPIPTPMNREQRRAAAKTMMKKAATAALASDPLYSEPGTHTNSIMMPGNNSPWVYPEQTATAAAQAANKARPAEDYAINTPDDAKAAQDAVKALRDDPEAMRQLAEVALKLAAERHV